MSANLSSYPELRLPDDTSTYYPDHPLFLYALEHRDLDALGSFLNSSIEKNIPFSGAYVQEEWYDLLLRQGWLDGLLHVCSFYEHHPDFLDESPISYFLYRFGFYGWSLLFLNHGDDPVIADFLQRSIDSLKTQLPEDQLEFSIRFDLSLCSWLNESSLSSSSWIPFFLNHPPSQSSFSSSPSLFSSTPLSISFSFDSQHPEHDAFIIESTLNECILHLKRHYRLLNLPFTPFYQEFFVRQLVKESFEFIHSSCIDPRLYHRLHAVFQWAESQGFTPSYSAYSQSFDPHTIQGRPHRAFIHFQSILQTPEFPFRDDILAPLLNPINPMAIKLNPTLSSSKTSVDSELLANAYRWLFHSYETQLKTAPLQAEQLSFLMDLSLNIFHPDFSLCSRILTDEFPSLLTSYFLYSDDGFCETSFFPFLTECLSSRPDFFDLLTQKLSILPPLDQLSFFLSPFSFHERLQDPFIHFFSQSLKPSHISSRDAGRLLAQFQRSYSTLFDTTTSHFLRLPYSYNLHLERTQFIFKTFFNFGLLPTSRFELEELWFELSPHHPPPSLSLFINPPPWTPLDLRQFFTHAMLHFDDFGHPFSHTLERFFSNEDPWPLIRELPFSFLSRTVSSSSETLHSEFISAFDAYRQSQIFTQALEPPTVDPQSLTRRL